MLRRPPRSSRTDTLVPYTTLFRSVNNAGVSIPAPIDGPDFDEQWATTLAVNLTAHTTTIRACLAHLRRNGDGRIVNIASTEGIGGAAYVSPYTRSEEHTDELQSLIRISSAAIFFEKKTNTIQ